MTLEREMRGLRAMSCLGLGGSTAGRGIFDGELIIVAAAAVSDGWPNAGDVGDSDPDPTRGGEDPKLVSGWLKIRVGRGESGFWFWFGGCWLGLRGDTMTALEEDAAWAALVRFGFGASVTGGRPEVRPVADCRTAVFVFARELAVGARREEGRLRREGWSFVSGDLTSALELVEASVLLLDVLRLVPIDETTVVPDVTLVLVPIDDTALVLPVWREAAVPLPVPVLLTRERAVPVMLLDLEAAVIVDLTVPESGGGLNDGIGDLERNPVDFVELIVPECFASAAEGGGLSSLLGCDAEVFLVFEAELEAFGAAGTSCAFAFSPFWSAAGACEVLGTGMLDGGWLAGAAAFALLPPPMFHTLRTSDFAAPKKPNRDFGFAISRQHYSASHPAKSTAGSNEQSATYLAAPRYSASPDCSFSSPSPRRARA